MKLNINTNAVVSFTNKLEKMHKSALPSAIRNTLNDVAFDVKLKTMPKEAKKHFKKRQPNFFRANSKVEKAQGFDMKTMKSTVGFYENNLGGKSNFAVQDLEQQENGGTIKKKSFIAMKGARKNNSKNKTVAPEFQMDKINGNSFIRTNRSGKNGRFGTKTRNLSKKQQFIRAAIMATKLHGNNAFVLGGKSKGGGRTLFKITELRTSGRYTKGKHNLSINRIPIYSVKDGRVTKVKAKNFMKRASLESGLNINSYYIKQAQRQFDKFSK